MSNEYVQIMNEATNRGISRLCHFTQSRKLAHILSSTSGILSTDRLKEVAPDLLDVTDIERLDGYTGHVCCSIEFPNTWYLRQIRNRDPLFKDWVIILLSPALLWRSGTLFCPRNAAAQHGTLVSPGYDSFMGLFQEQVTGAGGRTRSRTKVMLPCCPTDDQAEVLVPTRIPKEDILGIAVTSDEQARREINRLSLIGDIPDVKWIIAPELFGTGWSQLVRKGQRPAEELYTGEAVG